MFRSTGSPAALVGFAKVKTVKRIALSFAVALAFFNSTSVSAQAGYLTDWIEYNGHEYRMTDPMNWAAAEFLAQENNAHLVAINDAAELTWVYNTFATIAPDLRNGVWIGLWDGQQEGTFRWSNGESVTHTNWLANQPNDGGGQDFVTMAGPEVSPAKWNDVPGAGEFAGVMERPLVGADPGPVNLDAWLTDWIQHNGHEYRMTGSMNWTAAEMQARAAGAHLVAVNDAAESAWLYDTFVSVSPDQTYGAWIGLWDGQKEGTFRWSNGDPVTFTNWWANQPNNDGWGQDFVNMAGPAVAPATWNDVPGVRAVPGIAERVFIPEPSTLLLLGVGAVGLLAFRRRSRRT